MRRDDSDDTGMWLLNTPPTPRQTRLAVAAAAIPVFALAVFAPFASIRLAQINSFIPAFEGTIFVTDLVTSVLLFSQFSIYRSRALLALACGYLFSAVTLAAHGLTFPGAFSPSGLLGAGLQSTAWIYWFWHFGFPLSLLTYGLLKDEKSAKRLSTASVPFAIGGSVALVITSACALILLATAGNDFMPRLALDRVNIAPANHAVGMASMLLCASALAVLWIRRRSVLDQWLMVVAVAALCELGLAVMIVSGRYTLGFYAGRIFTFLTSTIVLVVLLVETTRLYARLARSNAILQQERNNKLLNLEAMVASIAHEVKQPLTGISTLSAATLRFLKQSPPNLVRAESCVDKVIIASHNAGQILDDIRSLVGRSEVTREKVDINSVAIEVLRDFDDDLKHHDIKSSLELSTNLPSVTGHRGQLRELMVNLINNAIEAMDSVGRKSRALKVKTELDAGGKIALVIQDSGPGLDSKIENEIFDAFVTTKSRGMGLGLAICRRIVELHEGQLTGSSANPSGAIFRVTLSGS